jgi:hypothetical protein
MSDRKITEVGGGMGPLGWVGILFIGLKLTGYINWSWWWVTAPFWAIPAVLLVVAVSIFFVAGMAVLLGR